MMIKLTEKQRKELERLWFIYGNSGPKSTKANHGYIQGFLEFGEDRKEFYRDGEENLKEKGFIKNVLEKYRLTDECVNAVEEVMTNDK